MKKMLLCLLVGFGWPIFSYATDLMGVYQQALDNDPIFKQAYTRYMSSSEAIPIARSALFPQLAINANAARNFSNIVIPESKLLTAYNSNQWQVNASQALFNYEAWAQVKQAKASVKAAQANFNDAAQALILRTAMAYFQVLLAKDVLSFAEAKKRANKRQFEQAEQRFKVGLDAITSVYEAKAGYDQSVAQVIAAKNNQINQNENLRKLTNYVYEHLAPLRNSRIPLIKPEPDNANAWVQTGLRQNYKLFAAKYGLLAARENIKIQSASGWPTFALQANTTQTHNKVHIPPDNNAALFCPSS